MDPKPWLLNKSGILGLLECYIGVGNERFMIPLFRNPVGPHQMASSTTSRISRTCTVRYVVSIFSSFKPAWWIQVFGKDSEPECANKIFPHQSMAYNDTYPDPGI